MDVKNQFFESVERYRCPVCNCKMIEIERIKENDYFFVWYECSRTACDEQFLEKQPHKAMAV